jgi:uncharacterized protein YabN with tetrapyrrole methylase and pyrophosphatase domain
MLGTQLTKLIELEHEARAFGFNWPNKEMIIDQAISECEEIKDAIAQGESNERIQEEIGDLLNAAVCLCVCFEFDVEATLINVNKKFGARLTALKEVAHEHGFSNLDGQSIELILKLWHEAKVLQKSYAIDALDSQT